MNCVHCVPDSASDAAKAADLLRLGLEQVRKAGGSPIAVVPSASIDVEAATIIVASDLVPGGNAAGDGPKAPVEDVVSQPVLVFPGPLSSLKIAIAERRLPDTGRALVLVEGAWEFVDLGPELLHRSARRRKAGLRQKASDAIAHRKAQAGSLLLPILPTRRVQPLMDRRESRLLDILEHSYDFPFRIVAPRPRRVLLGISRLGGGGAERQLVNTAEGLVKRGIDDVHFALVDGADGDGQQDHYYERARRFAVGIHPLAGGDFAGLPWVIAHPELRGILTDYLLNQILGAARSISRLRPEIMQVSLDWTNVIFGLGAALAGVPRIFLSGRNLAPHHFEFFQWFMYPCYRALACLPQVHLTNNSEAGRDSYAKWLRLDRSQITVVRNGLHAEEFPVTRPEDRARIRDDLGIAQDAPVITGAFRLSSEKRPWLWLETAARVRARLPNATFLLCGTGSMMAEVEARARTLGLGGSLQLLGSRPDIQSIFAASDVVLQTALQEGTPNTLIEAQAMGVPVVTTAAFGAAEAVSDGVSGIIVAKDTAQQLSDAVLKLLFSPEILARAKTEGPRFIRERFGFERMIDDTLITYAAAGADWAVDLLPAEKRHARQISLGAFRHESGHCWVVDVPEITYLADTVMQPMRSTVVVLEDGRPIGPAHALHADIRSKGGGAYSHWDKLLLMSSSDGTSPRENGRTYTLLVPHARPPAA